MKNLLFINIRCEKGVLSVCYPTNDLMAYESNLPFPGIDKNSDLPIVSLREAARIQKEIKCN